MTYIFMQIVARISWILQLTTAVPMSQYITHGLMTCFLMTVGGFILRFVFGQDKAATTTLFEHMVAVHKKNLKVNFPKLRNWQ